MQPEKHSVM